MKQLKAILLFAGIAILFSCISNVSYPEAMQKAIRCMDECPDSARIYLSSLDSVIQFEPEETQMYYGLLTTQTKDKLYICHTSDSLMLAIVHFYESYGNTEKLMEAYYYLGSVYRDMKDVPRALETFQQAADTGKDSQWYEVLGRIYEQIGTLFAYQSLYEDALNKYKTAYVYRLKEGKGFGLVYALRNLGRMHESLNRPDSAEYYYQAAYRKAFELNNPKVIKSISVELGNVYLNLGKPDSAKKVFSRIPEFKDDAIYLKGLGSIFLLTAQYDSTQFYFLEALQEGKHSQNIYMKNAIYKALAQIEVQKDNYHSAFDYAQKSMELEDSIKNITRTEAIGKIHALYNYRHAEKENQQLLLKNERNTNQIYLLIIGILLLSGIAAVYTSYLRKQKHRTFEQNKRLLQLKEEQHKESLSLIDENNKKIIELETLLQQTAIQKNVMQKQLIQLQKNTLESSNRKIQSAQDEKKLLIIGFQESNIYRIFHQVGEFCDMPITEENWNELQQFIDTIYLNFTNRLYALCPQLSEQELHLCYLIKISIPVKNIARILNRTTQAISNARSRLYKKIHRQEGSASLFDEFITDL